MTVKRSRTLPHAARAVDAAMGLVCTLPITQRGARRISVRSVIERAAVVKETADGVVLRFNPSDEIPRIILDLVLAERSCCAQFRYAIRFDPPHDAVELHVEADGDLVRPLQDLYLHLAAEARDA